VGVSIPHRCNPGYALRLQRLVLANVELPDPIAEVGIPRLWPLGLYAEPGSQLYMADVRLVVRDADLQRYMQFFQGQNSTQVQFYTVSSHVVAVGAAGCCSTSTSTVVCCSRGVIMHSVLLHGSCSSAVSLCRAAFCAIVLPAVACMQCLQCCSKQHCGSVPLSCKQVRTLVHAASCSPAASSTAAHTTVLQAVAYMDHLQVL
jgi:hypothetical protein